MFGLEYILALVNALFKVAFSIVTAIPFWISWNAIAPKYFYFLPGIYQKLPYWHVVGLLIIVWVVGEQIQQLTPKIISIKQKKENKK